ncbi:hypothetical protein [uncultured Desulfobacter sp.]|uniref:hypothetical protein n=1 Tax=uncultured Desulfobacter sp. TaxID=240139 RepID=UPI0029F50CCB|nr:hypothetical protein [uncultured Desulfobacter sp.]
MSNNFHFRSNLQPRSPRPKAKWERQSSLWSKFGDWAIKYHDVVPGRMNRDAVELMDNAGNEYFNAAHALIKKKGGYSKLTSLEHAKVEGLKTLSGLSYYVASVAKYLGPQTGSDWIGSVATIPAGGGKAIIGKVVKGAKRAVEAIHAYEVGHLAHKLVKNWNVTRNVHGSRNGHPLSQGVIQPRVPFKQHPWSQIPVSPARKNPIKRAVQRNNMVPRYSFLDQVKVADWMLQSMHKSTIPKSRPYDPFLSTTERLRRIEKRGMEKFAEQRRMSNLLGKFERSISNPQPFDAHRQMRQKYGARIDAIANKSTPFKPGSANMSAQDWKTITRTLNNIQRSKPLFNANPQTMAPQVGSLRWTSQGLRR